MSQYAEYKPKKPRNFKIVVLAGITALLITGLMIAYAMVASAPNEASIEYPEKIVSPAGEQHSLFQMEENIISEKFTIDEADIDAIEEWLFSEDRIPAEKVIPEKTPDKPVAVKETYKPIFVATPDSPQWMANAVIAEIDPNKPMIAIVIDDLGIDKRRTQRTIDLPAPLNLAFLPYPTQLSEQTKAAKDAGHELMVHMPMEPSNLSENNPGPKALLTKNGKALNLENLKANLDQFDGYVGINNHMGSRFTSDYNAMGPILEELKRRGLLFLDSRTIGSSKGKKLAGELDLPFVARDVFLDHDPSRAGVDASLAKTARIALSKGTAIAIGHPKDDTIAALKVWIPKAKAQGIQIVPLTAIAYKRMGLSMPAVPVVIAQEKEEPHTDTDQSDDKTVILEDSVEIEDKPTEEVIVEKPVTVTIGGEKDYDAIIWTEPEPSTY